MTELEVFDAHVHLEEGADVGYFFREIKKVKAKVQFGVSSCGPMFCQPGNGAVEELMKSYPGQVVGFGYVALGRGDGPETVEDLHRRGFKALKVINPLKDYDDKSFYPIYEIAETLGMPILFHVGGVARSDLHAKRYLGHENDDFRKYDISSKRMQPICLDAIARAFPRLNLIMAHFGASGRTEEIAAMLFHPNVYADITHLTALWRETRTEVGVKVDMNRVKENAKMIKKLLPNKLHKLIFGTDTLISSKGKYYSFRIASVKALFNELEISREIREGILSKTIKKILNT